VTHTKVGAIVRLKGKKRSARVVALLRDIPGGVQLDRPLDGFRYWNLDDLARGYKRHLQNARP